MDIKSILFHSDRIPAVRDGRMTVCRMPVKRKCVEIVGRPKGDDKGQEGFLFNVIVRRKGKDPYSAVIDIKPPYQPGDILYVKETYDELPVRPDGSVCSGSNVLYYKADGDLRPRAWRISWKPALQMPKEAARTFLKVTDVRVEQLRDIEMDPPGPDNQIVREGFKYGCDLVAHWENACSPSQRQTYGYFANPWVWVLTFERCCRPEEMHG